MMFLIPFHVVHASTLEEMLNNLTGPKQQYNTMLSPVYLKTTQLNESINPQSGELSLNQTDYVLPGRNGLNLEIKRIYKNNTANVQEMKVKYVNGAWVDYVKTDTSSFYEDRYNLGIGTRFSFPTLEIKKNNDGTNYKFLHTETGDVYPIKSYLLNGNTVYYISGQTIKDAVFEETNDNIFSNGQNDGSSKYVLTRKDGKKTYFSEDGRILGIVDRYGNKITFEYTTLDYTIDDKKITKRLIGKITDTMGRVVTIDYKEDTNFTVSPLSNKTYDHSYDETQNPNNIDSGDLQGRFQVIIHLPGDKKIIYDKSAVLVSPSKHVLRTRLQRVYDTDGKLKYHFWYEQPELGFTFMSGRGYSAFIRHENLTQIDYVKTNRIKRYIYNTYTKRLNTGSMQYQKIFATEDLIKKGYDATQAQFLDRFETEVKNKEDYAYFNEPDGYKYPGYNSNDDKYLKNTYRYYTEVRDMNRRTIRYIYDGIHELLHTIDYGNDHRQVIDTERDEMKLVKKKQVLTYPVKDGQLIGNPVIRIENYRYDEYGNLTNYNGPNAERDASGYPINTEHTVVYSYAYDKFNTMTLKTWKKDKDTTAQIINTVDSLGNIVTQTKVNTEDKNQWIVTNYQYDSYGNLTRKEENSAGQSFATNYEYNVDYHGVDLKGAYLTKEYKTVDGKELSKKYAYDINTGNLIGEIDPKGNESTYQYDILNRVTKVLQPDNSEKEYHYEQNPYMNLKIEYKDPDNNHFLYEYDIIGDLVKASVFDKGNWQTLKTLKYDAKGNKIEETDSNGNKIVYGYDSEYRLISKTYYAKGIENKGTFKLEYLVGYDAETPLLVKTTDEEGYITKYHYDNLFQLSKVEKTPDNTIFYTKSFTYDYVGDRTSVTDERNNTSQYEYDSLGRLTNKIDALGIVTEINYNALNKVIRKKEPNGKTTEYAYDNIGRVSNKKIYKDGSNDYHYTSYAYDLNSNVTNIKQGSLMKGINQLSSDTSYSYDNMNHLTDEYDKIDDTRISHTKNNYDNKGNKLQTIKFANEEENKFIVYNYTYDFAGRLTDENGAYKEDNGKSNYIIHGNYEKKYEYDYAGNLMKKQILNENNNYDTTTYQYNYKNKVKEIVEPYKSNEVVKKTELQYDKVGNVTSKTLEIQGVASTSTVIYDGLGRIIKKINPNGYITRFVYDSSGNLIKEIDPRYISLSEEDAPGIEYEYDKLNRRIKTIAFDGKTREVVIYREYNPYGKVIKDVNGEGYNVENPKDSIGNIYEYDIYGNKVTYISAQTAADNLKNGTDYITNKYTYNSLGNVLSNTDSLGNEMTYTYYLNGLLKGKVFQDHSKESYDYDLTGKLFVKKIDRANHITNIWKNIFNKPYLVEYPDGITQKLFYSPKGELIEIEDQLGYSVYFAYDPSGNRISSKQYIKEDDQYKYYQLDKYNYDEANRLINSETFMDKFPEVSTLPEVEEYAGNLVEYKYDKAGHLLQSNGPFGRETINQYDKAGNVITKKQKIDDNFDGIKRFTYNFRNQLISQSTLLQISDLSINDMANATFDNEYLDRVLSTTNYTYDKSGNLKTVKNPEGNITQYEYNDNNQLTKKIDPLQATTKYFYDSRGNVSKVINTRGVSKKYEYDSLNQLIREKTPAADGTLAVKRYIYDVMGNLVKQIDPNHYDADKDTEDLVQTMIGVSYQYDKMNRRIATISPSGEITQFIKYNDKGQVEKVIDGLRYTGDVSTSVGTQYDYDGRGKITHITDALGNTTSFEYDVLGNLQEKTDARGYTTHYDYNPDNTLASVIYPDSGMVSYTYDKLGRKTSYTDQRGHKTTYTYNGFGKKKIITDPDNYTVESKYDLNGNLVSLKDKRGSITLFKYDPLNRLIEKKTPLYFDGSNNVVYEIESDQYNELGKLLKQTITDSKDSQFKRETSYTYYDNNLVKTVSNNNGAYTKYDYDKNGNKVKSETLRDARVYDIARFEYDAQNRLIKQIQLVDEASIYNAEKIPNINNLRDPEYPDKMQMITGFSYDVIGNKTQVISPKAYQYLASDTSDRAKYTTIYTYDLLNRIDKIIINLQGEKVYKQYTYDEVGYKKTVRNERGYITVYSYDGLNRVKTITDPKQNTLTYQYDLAGNRITVTNAKNESLTYTYDKLNRLDMIIDAYQKVINKKIYDANGSVIKDIDAKGYLSADTDDARYGTLNEYDLANRLVKTVDPEIQKYKDATKFTVKYSYNPVGEMISQTDALGYTTSYQYDNGGNLLKVIDPKHVTTSYSYDREGNKLYMTSGRKKVTSYQYGAFGKLEKVTDADNKGIGYQYDLNGNIALMIDKNGNHTIYNYDNRNLLLNKTVAETGDSIAYTYDEAGNRFSMNDQSGTYQYSYDENNQLLEMDKDEALHIKYTYDPVGNIKTVIDKTGFTTTYTYDKSNRMKTVSFNDITITYGYDDNGNRNSIQYASGLKVEYTFNKNNKLLVLTNKNSSGAVISTYTYSYDDVGRRIQKTDSFGITVYHYDPDGRVSGVETPGKISVYTYDNDGNRQSLNETYTSNQPSDYIDQTNNKPIEYKIKKSEYIYSNTNKLLQLVEKMYDENEKAVLRKTTSYLYDDNGNERREKVEYLLPYSSSIRQVTTANAYGDYFTNNLISLMNNTSNVYDGFNRLTHVERIKDGNRVTVDFIYNGDDLRTKKIVKDSKEGYTPKETNYLYDRQHVILETDQADKLLDRFIKGINYLARIDTNGKTSYYLYNGHGDVVQTVSKDGTPENQYDYDIFGNPTLTIEQYNNAIRYAGEFYDQETGLYYLRARYYNPYIGRFISEDSYWGEDINPLSLNLYTYTKNNPIMFVDPSGHADIEDIKMSKEEIIAAIDKQKEIWWNDEKNGEGKHKEGNSKVQQAAHEEANRLKEELKKLEKGNKEVEKLIEEKNAGDWETYKAKILEEKINVRMRHNLSVTPYDIFQYTKLLAMAEVAKKNGRNVFDDEKWDQDAIHEKTTELFGEDITVTENNDIIFNETGEVWHYVGMDVRRNSSSSVGSDVSFYASFGSDKAYKANEKAASNSYINFTNKEKFSEKELLLLAQLDTKGVKDLFKQVKINNFANMEINVGLFAAMTWADISTIIAEVNLIGWKNAFQRFFKVGEKIEADVSAEAELNIENQFLNQLDKKFQSNMEKINSEGAGKVQAPQKVIGHYPEYVEMSSKLGTKPFSIPDNIWSKMTPSEQWAANQKFLDRAIAKGSEFNLATPIDKVRPGSFLQKEIEYLTSQGYKLSSDGTKLLK